MKLSYFPQIRIVHTSKKFHGQLYIPIANWLLMIGTILVASIYNNVCLPPEIVDTRLM
jgi:KUP system potassium uptake protein